MSIHEILSYGFLIVIVVFLGFNLWWSRKGKAAKQPSWQLPNYNRKHVDKPWGGEDIWACTTKYVGKLLHIKEGHQLSKQYHKVKDESIIIISGKMEMQLEKNGNTMFMAMAQGDCLHIPPGTIHRMVAITDVVVAEVSTPELDDVVRLEDSYGRVL